MRENGGKMGTRITLNTDTFYAMFKNSFFRKEKKMLLNFKKKIKNKKNKKKIGISSSPCQFKQELFVVLFESLVFVMKMENYMVGS